MSSYSFTKLFSSITDSSIWSEDSDTKVVWVTLLAMADAHGVISAALPGISKRAGVSLEKTEEALNKFESPDKFSRSTEFEGRRILKVDGGWQLLNYTKYREKRSEAERKEYLKEYMREYRTKTVNNTVNNVNKCKPALTERKPPLTQAEAEAEAEEDKNYEALNKEKDVLSYLNTKSKRCFEPLNSNLKLITARFKEGYTVEKLKAIIDIKCSEWLNDPKMHKYVRPATLFNAEKCASYAGEIGVKFNSGSKRLNGEEIRAQYGQ